MKLNRTEEEDLKDEEKEFLSEFRNNTNIIDSMVIQNNKFLENQNIGFREDTLINIVIFKTKDNKDSFKKKVKAG